MLSLNGNFPLVPWVNGWILTLEPQTHSNCWVQTKKQITLNFTPRYRTISSDFDFFFFLLQFFSFEIHTKRIFSRFRFLLPYSNALATRSRSNKIFSMLSAYTIDTFCVVTSIIWSTAYWFNWNGLLLFDAEWNIISTNRSAGLSLQLWIRISIQFE